MEQLTVEPWFMFELSSLEIASLLLCFDHVKDGPCKSCCCYHSSSIILQKFGLLSSTACHPPHFKATKVQGSEFELSHLSEFRLLPLFSLFLEGKPKLTRWIAA